MKYVIRSGVLLYNWALNVQFTSGEAPEFRLRFIHSFYRMQSPPLISEYETPPKIDLHHTHLKKR